MSDGEPIQVPSSRLFVIRVIHFSLLTGCAVFAVIAVVMRNKQVAPPPNPPIITYVVCVVAVTVGIAFLVVPNLLLADWRRRIVWTEAEFVSSGDQRYWDVYQTTFIVRAALLEGAIFMQLVAYLIEGQGLSLGVAAFFWLALLLQFPTQNKMIAWLNQQRELIEQERQKLS